MTTTELTEAKRVALKKACVESYMWLVDMRNHWDRRFTGPGQALLCSLRDAISFDEERSGQDVQDDYARRVFDKTNS